MDADQSGGSAGKPRSRPTPVRPDGSGGGPRSVPPSPWADREVVAFHLAFAGAAVLGLFLPGPAPSGWRMAGLVALYLMALPAWAWWRGHREWLDLFAFLLPGTEGEGVENAPGVVGVEVRGEDGGCAARGAPETVRRRGRGVRGGRRGRDRRRVRR